MRKENKAAENPAAKMRTNLHGIVMARKGYSIRLCRACARGRTRGSRILEPTSRALSRCESKCGAEPSYGPTRIPWPQLVEPAALGCITGLGAALPLEGKGYWRDRSSPAKVAMAVMAARSCWREGI